MTSEGDAAHSTSRAQSPSSTAAAGAGAPSNSPQSSSSLSTGVKVGIGVGVALGVIALAVILFLLFRRKKGKNKPNSGPNPSTTTSTIKDDPFEHDKAELVGGYDPAVAGPVKRKPELETTPTNESLSGSRRPPELADGSSNSAIKHPTSHHELSAGSNTGAITNTSELGFSDKATPISASHSHAHKSVPLPVASAMLSSQTQHQNHHQIESHDELTEEADTLVSELSVISKRKKALTAAATAAGAKPEDVEGRKGDEWRELVQREEKVRRRMEAVQEALGESDGV